MIRDDLRDTTLVMETAQSNIDCLLVLPPASLEKVTDDNKYNQKKAHNVIHRDDEWLPGGITAVARVFRKVNPRAGQQGIV